MFENPENKNFYLLTLRTYNILNDSEVDRIRKKKDTIRLDKFVIYESSGWVIKNGNFCNKKWENF